MKIKQKANIIAACLAAVLVLIIIIFARPSSRLLLTLLPPADLYNHLVEKQILLHEAKAQQSFILKHNYVGTYFVGIYIDKPPPDPYGTPIDTSTKLGFTINSDHGELFKKTFSRWSNRFGGSVANKAGVILGYYKVPEEIPLNKTVVATICVDHPDQLFQSKFGEAVFFIERAPDL